MDAIKIVALLKAAEHGSLTKASEELGYTQAGLTHMMNRLEKEIGLKLLQRTKSGVKLTDEAQTLLPLLRKFSDADAELTNAINSIISNDSKALRIGSYPGFASRYLPGIIKDFKTTDSEVKTEIFIGNYTDLKNKYSSGELDMIFISENDEVSENTIHLTNDKFCVVYNKATDCDFTKSTFILPSNENEQEIENIVKSNGISPASTIKVNDDSTIISMISAGLGFTVMPESNVKNNDNCVVKPLDTNFVQKIYIVTKPQKLLSKSESDFVKSVKKTFHKA